MTKFTRQDRLNGNCTHEEYFAQFVNDRTIDAVVSFIGEDVLRRSTDENLNDIPLDLWDKLSAFIPLNIRFDEVGEVPSIGTYVCIAKEAARQFLGYPDI